MNLFCNHDAHPRRLCAHFALHCRRQRRGRTRLPFRANQLSSRDTAGFSRPLHQAVRLASAPESVGSVECAKYSWPVIVTPNLHALIVARFDGVLGLRPLALLPARACHNQSNFTDLLGFARPFASSAGTPVACLWRHRISGCTSMAIRSSADGVQLSSVCKRALSLELLEHSPRSDVMEHSDFPGGNHRSIFCVAKNPVLRVSGTLRRHRVSRQRENP